MNIKVSVFGLALLGTALYYLNPEPIDKVTHEENVITLDGTFSPESSKGFTEDMKDINSFKGPGERALFTIHSPGGYVSSGEEMIHAMKTGVPTDTYIPIFGASMGARSFISGVRRYIEPGAELVFHGAFAGDYVLNVHTFRKAESIIQDEKTSILVEGLRRQGVVNIDDLEDPKFLIKLASSIGIDTSNPVALTLAIFTYVNKGKDVAIQEMKSQADSLDRSNEASVRDLTRIMNQAGKNVTEDFVRTEILKDHKEDVYMFGQEAFDLGIATHLGAPPEKDYVSQ